MSLIVTVYSMFAAVECIQSLITVHSVNIFSNDIVLLVAVTVDDLLSLRPVLPLLLFSHTCTLHLITVLLHLTSLLLLEHPGPLLHVLTPNACHTIECW